MPRIQQNAAIRRASWSAQRQANQIDADFLKRLTALYQSVLMDIQSQINNSAGINSVLGLENLRSTATSINYSLSKLAEQQGKLLKAGMQQNARAAAQVFSSVVNTDEILRITSDAVRIAQQFVAADGLQLSDRIWRIDSQAREKIGSAIQSAIIQGHSASQAAQDFINRGLAVPSEYNIKMNVGNAKSINSAIAHELIDNPNSVYSNAKRLFRTEINRAHITAYQQSLVGVDGVVGTRFLLSRNHPKRDICDMHARANLYGLGPGVYPLGKSPLPAHPNTLSYEVAVFEEEVSSVHKANRQTRTEWLAEQDPKVQTAVLNSWGKQRAFNAGLLPENAFSTPWSVVKERLIKQGYDPKQLPRTKAPAISALDRNPNPFASRDKPEFIRKNSEVRFALQKYVAGLGLKNASVDILNSTYQAFDVVLGRFNLQFNTLRWTSWENVGGYYRSKDKQMALGKMHVWRSKIAPSTYIESFLEGKDKRISDLKNALLNANSDDAEYLRQQLVREIMAFRHGVTDDSIDSVFSTMAHEAGHTLFRTFGLTMHWHFALKRFNVNYGDHALVSHYAAFNESELFSEVTSLLAQGRETEVPKGILKAYNLVIESVIN